MARWVKSKQSMRIFKTATQPTSADGLTVGDLWLDITSGATLKVCTALPGTFSTSSGAPSDNPTFTTGITTPKITFNSTTGIVGTTTNDNAASGSVGQVVSSVVTQASPGSALTTSTAANVTSISLTAGDWEVWGSVGVSNSGGATTVQRVAGWTSSTSATVPSGDELLTIELHYSSTIGTFGSPNTPVISKRYSLSGTTTVYLSIFAAFAVANLLPFGTIYARRIR